MSKVQAISFNQVQCGKKLAETKKRFKWVFKINGVSHTLELANSALSGKRVVTLDSTQIYTQKNLLNIDFDFSQPLEGHYLRITRVPDNLNKYQLRIDNTSFDDLLNKTGFNDFEKKQKSSTKIENDPFSDFGNFVGKSKAENNNNQFGEFDFDFTSKATEKSNSAAPAKIPSQKVQQFDILGSSNLPNTNKISYETINFQTNNFQTNNFGNFIENFQKCEQDLLNEDNFATNTYANNNYYNDLMNAGVKDKSQIWGAPKEDKPEGLTDKFKIEMTAKQALNKVKKTAEQIKNKIVGNNESLI